MFKKFLALLLVAVVGLVSVPIVGFGNKVSANVWCQCTQYVYNKASLSGSMPDAKDWGNGFLQSNGYVQVGPEIGAIVVMQGGVGDSPTAGHVGFLHEVYANNTMNILGGNQTSGGNYFIDAGCTNVRYTPFGTTTSSPGLTFWKKPAVQIVPQTREVNSANFTPLNRARRVYQAITDTDGNINTRYSSDGATWSPWLESGSTYGNVTQVAHNNSFFQVTVGKSGRIFYRSTTGQEVNNQTPIFNTWTDIPYFSAGIKNQTPLINSYDGKLFITYRNEQGNVQTYVSSDNGLTWPISQLQGGGKTDITSFQTTNGVPTSSHTFQQLLVGNTGALFIRVYNPSTSQFNAWQQWYSNTGSVATSNNKVTTSVTNTASGTVVRLTLVGSSANDVYESYVVSSNPANNAFSPFASINGGKSNVQVSTLGFGANHYECAKGLDSQGNNSVSCRNFNGLSSPSAWDAIYGSTTQNPSLFEIGSSVYVIVTGQSLPNTLYFKTFGSTGAWSQTSI